MTENKTLQILKQAILMEKRGKAFYLKVADQAQDEEVKTFFNTMAEEEQHHMEMLTEHYKSYTDNGSFNLVDYEAESQVAQIVLDDNVKKKLSSADFEAAAISAAMFMEEKAISVYGARAESSDNPEEKALYSYLASWEREHLKFLSDIDRELTEKVWYDNNYWPF